VDSYIDKYPDLNQYKYSNTHCYVHEYFYSDSYDYTIGDRDA
jgi:hypothetical protein